MPRFKSAFVTTSSSFSQRRRPFDDQEGPRHEDPRFDRYRGRVLGHQKPDDRQAAERAGSKTIVFAFGGDHKYGIEEILPEHYGVTARLVTRLFEHSDAEVPDAVVKSWVARREKLDAAMKGDTAPGLIKSYPAKRIAAVLEKAISARGVAQ